ncbi:NADH:flavin oxidoreductase [Arthrobacter sp. S39]|uniref:NADH:flavin oxidoreductase n=1 Tax=Arthrobacter sp. S39 TaxID=2509720 RepID=UPI0010378F95|nr:NADH:flavin oxidoreductase [Arthrobacter sp. S39]TAP43217.1 NADH:flavin oxidoreductase [Arthrobacter sp. S39]
MPADSQTADLSPLFAPFDIGPLNLRNRFVMAPMTREFSPNGVPGPDVAAYYSRRAAAGVGLIITEGTYIDHPAAGDSGDVPQLFGDAALDGWRSVVDGVHAAGGAIIPQLWHRGGRRSPGTGPNPEVPSISPSGVSYGKIPAARAASLGDIEEIVASYARAAGTAQALGFDGIELHGAHGYLIDQFLWERTNQRTDAYGGDPAGRARFAVEVVMACREATGPDFPVSFRLSNWKAGDYSAVLAPTAKQLGALLHPIAEAGVDVFHVSTRRFFEPAFEGSPLTLAGSVRKLTGISTIAVGSVGLDGDLWTAYTDGGRAKTTSMDGIIDRFSDDEFDLVGVGRALLSDPQWVAKLERGAFDELHSFAAEDRHILH